MSLEIGNRISGATLFDAPAAVPYRPFSSLDSAAVLNDFTRRLADLEKAVKLSVPGDRITSMIALTSDTALISAEKVAVVGETTFFDWLMDVNGQVIGVDPKFTQIRGPVIRTGKIASFDALSWLDLDATGDTEFLKGTTGVSVSANGKFRFGPSGGSKTLAYDGTDLTLGGNALIVSTAASTVVAGAAVGAAYPGDFTSSILANSGTSITVTSSTLFSMPGTSSGGVFIGSGGLIGKNTAGTVKFSLDATTGLLTAVDGTFSGTLKATAVDATGRISSGKTSATDATHTGFWFAGSGDFIVGNTTQNLKLASTVLTFTGDIDTSGKMIASGSIAAPAGGSSASVIGYNTAGTNGVLGVNNSSTGGQAVYGQNLTGYGTGVYGSTSAVTGGIGVLGNGAGAGTTAGHFNNASAGLAIYCNGVQEWASQTLGTAATPLTAADAPTGHTVLKYMACTINGAASYLLYV